MVSEDTLLSLLQLELKRNHYMGFQELMENLRNRDGKVINMLA